MNKRKLTTLLLMLAALSTAAGAAYAYFSTTAQSTDNVIGTGSMRLVLTDANDTDLQTITHSWSGSGIMPGSMLPQTKIGVRNASTVNAHHIDLRISYTGSENLAKNIHFSNNQKGFKFGGDSDDTAVNLTTALRGFSDTDYNVKQPDGTPFTATTVDGIDGTTPDGKISLNEIAKYGKFRIEKNTEVGGINSNTSADLYVNADASTDLQTQNESVNTTFAFTLEQDASQF